jgi:hypothetical protein
VASPWPLARRLRAASLAWATTPYSAVRCMASVRMWTSTGSSPGPITPVWSDW